MVTLITGATHCVVNLTLLVAILVALATGADRLLPAACTSVKPGHDLH